MGLSYCVAGTPQGNSSFGITVYALATLRSVEGLGSYMKEDSNPQRANNWFLLVLSSRFVPQTIKVYYRGSCTLFLNEAQFSRAFMLIAAHPQLRAIFEQNAMIAMKPGLNFLDAMNIHDSRPVYAKEVGGV